MRILRAFLFLTLALSISTLMLPARAENSPAPKHKCCHAAAENAHVDGKIDNGCGHEPVKSQDQPCCAGCAMCFAMIAANSQRFIFPKRDGQRFGHDEILCASRADRPPVPPPRA